MCEVGSTGPGISVSGDDRDEMGVMIEGSTGRRRARRARQGVQSA
jgi:hypothetical protein